MNGSVELTLQSVTLNDRDDSMTQWPTFASISPGCNLWRKLNAKKCDFHNILGLNFYQKIVNCLFAFMAMTWSIVVKKESPYSSVQFVAVHG